jgi:hypothetical protein
VGCHPTKTITPTGTAVQTRSLDDNKRHGCGHLDVDTVFENLHLSCCHYKLDLSSWLAAIHRHRNAINFDRFNGLAVNDCRQGSSRCWQEPTFDSKTQARP